MYKFKSYIIPFSLILATFITPELWSNVNVNNQAQSSNKDENQIAYYGRRYRYDYGRPYYYNNYYYRYDSPTYGYRNYTYAPYRGYGYGYYQPYYYPYSYGGYYYYDQPEFYLRFGW
jgi:hypothetical protein